VIIEVLSGLKTEHYYLQIPRHR